ncbi:general secretion pathway protein GspL [Duganella sp. Leaf126]|uniref:type II secretion system protein GspL n=1 Tax=Duganella sp. Leaf126 TaxID=1736266 RepID=UPI0006F5F954|nr:type II secretion system protein GspL [Duganella sp. Leaf126]KQQ32631.1 general secretion pathway protein GspL [Duganella sp. Leaf126]
MTTLFIRYPAKASVDSGAAQTCDFALLADGGAVQQQGAAPLGNLGAMVASARRVTLMLAASDVTLLRIKTPPLSPARLKAALPALVEEHILGDTADCVLAASATAPDGLRTVAVVQRAWLEVLVKALIAQGAHSVSAVPAQLCLPFQPGAVSASLETNDAGFELALRRDQFDGLGLTLPAQPQAALHTVRALAGAEPVTLYLPAADIARFAPLLAEVNHNGDSLTLEEDRWEHRVAAARTAGLDLAPALGASGAAAREWRRWRWPLRLAGLALLVNVVGLNLDYLGQKREMAAVQQSMNQAFQAAYPGQPKSTDLVKQMRQNVERAKGGDGQAPADSFLALSVDVGEVLATLPRRDVVASIDYRERALQLKVKPNTVDAAAMAQLRTALEARQLELAEATPGTWQIRRKSLPKSAAKA